MERSKGSMGALAGLIGHQVADGASYVFGLRQDGVFEPGLIRDESIGGGHAADRGSEFVE
jgi:hypothetical protein